MLVYKDQNEILNCYQIDDTEIVSKVKEASEVDIEKIKMTEEDQADKDEGKKALTTKKVIQSLAGSSTPKALTNKQSAALDAVAIDKSIIKFRKDNKLTKNQNLMLDYLLLGTYKRGNLTQIRKLEAGRETYDPVLADIISHLKSLAAGTSYTKLGYGSNALSTNQSMVNMVGTVSSVINDAWRPPTAEQIQHVQTTAANMPKKVKESTDIDYLEEDVMEKLQYTSGVEGLREGVEISEVPKSMRESVLELTNYVKNENGKFQKNFNEVVRSLLDKDINAMNFEDYAILNNWFKDVKSGTLMQRLFKESGATKLAKRHHWLFPRTIARELMRDDIELMEEKGLYFTKTGDLLTGKLMRPTQNIEIIQKWIHRTMDSASKMTDEYTRKIKEDLLFVNSIPEGEVLRQIAVREREKQYYDELPVKTKKDNIDSIEYYERYNDIIKHHGDKL